MKTKLHPHNQKLYEQAIQDVDKALAGKPSSYTNVTLLIRSAAPKSTKRTRRLSKVHA